MARDNGKSFGGSICAGSLNVRQSEGRLWSGTGFGEILSVDLPRPRDRATLLLARFAELREHVWGTLMADARQAELEVVKR